MKQKEKNTKRLVVSTLVFPLASPDLCLSLQLIILQLISFELGTRTKGFNCVLVKHFAMSEQEKGRIFLEIYFFSFKTSWLHWKLSRKIVVTVISMKANGENSLSANKTEHGKFLSFIDATEMKLILEEKSKEMKIVVFIQVESNILYWALSLYWYMN